MIVSIGVDIIELSRIRDVLSRFGERFLARVLTEGEQSYCARKRDPVPSLAGRFAAKEAVAKALGTGISAGVGWRDIEVVRDQWGPPRIELHRRAAERAKELGAARVHFSLTHGRDAAVAVAVLED